MQLRCQGTRNALAHWWEVQENLQQLDPGRRRIRRRHDSDDEDHANIIVPKEHNNNDVEDEKEITLTARGRRKRHDDSSVDMNRSHDSSSERQDRPLSSKTNNFYNNKISYQQGVIELLFNLCFATIFAFVVSYVLVNFPTEELAFISADIATRSSSRSIFFRLADVHFIGF